MTGPGRPEWRSPRVLGAAAVAVVSLTVAGVLAFTGRDDGAGDGAGDVGPLPTMPSTTLDDGGIEVPAPDGWTAAPVPSLGFGVAVPPGWEAVVLADEMLASLGRSSPAVEGFVEAAHAAAASGAVFYAAGEDGDGRVTDLKVRAAPEAGVTDTAGLEAYARALAADSGVAEAAVEPVEGADRPTVRVRFRATATSDGGQQVPVVGVETLVVGPRDIVWSLIVTGEDRATVDDVAPAVAATFTLAPA